MSNTKEEEDEIRDLIGTWMDATKTGDLAGVLSLMAQDVVFLTCGNPPMQGPAAFEKQTGSLMKKVRMEGKSEIQEIQVTGDYAYCWSHLTVKITLLKGDSSPKTRQGQVLSVFRKVKGHWLLFRDANMLSDG